MDHKCGQCLITVSSSEPPCPCALLDTNKPCVLLDTNKPRVLLDTNKMPACTYIQPPKHYIFVCFSLFLVLSCRPYVPCVLSYSLSSSSSSILLFFFFFLFSSSFLLLFSSFVFFFFLYFFFFFSFFSSGYVFSLSFSSPVY